MIKTLFLVNASTDFTQVGIIVSEERGRLQVQEDKISVSGKKKLIFLTVIILGF